MNHGKQISTVKNFNREGDNIKTFRHVLVFDKHSISQNITNNSDSIMDLLTNSPVIINDSDQTKVAGYITNLEHRTGGLYFGDVYLIDKLDNDKFNKIDVVKTDLAYKNVSENSIDVTGFITYVKRL